MRPGLDISPGRGVVVSATVHRPLSLLAARHGTESAVYALPPHRVTDVRTACALDVDRREAVSDVGGACALALTDADAACSRVEIDADRGPAGTREFLRLHEHGLLDALFLRVAAGLLR